MRAGEFWATYSSGPASDNTLGAPASPSELTDEQIDGIAAGIRGVGCCDCRAFARAVISAATIKRRGALLAEQAALLDALRRARQELRFQNLTDDGGQRTNTAIARVLVDVDAAIAKSTGA